MATLEQLDLASQEVEDAKKELIKRIHAFNRLRTEYIQAQELPEEGKFFIGFYADGNMLSNHIIFTCANDTVLLAMSRSGIAPPDYYVPTPYDSYSEAGNAFNNNEEITEISISGLLRMKVIEPFVTTHARIRVPDFLVTAPQVEKKG